jgi:hypothetical protein
MNASRPRHARRKRLLDRALGIVERAEHPVPVELELPARRLGELLEHGLVECARRVLHAGIVYWAAPLQRRLA